MPWVVCGGKRGCCWFITLGLHELLTWLKVNLEQLESKEGRKTHPCRQQHSRAALQAAPPLSEVCSSCPDSWMLP